MNTIESAEFTPTADEMRSHRMRSAAIRLVTSLQAGDDVADAWGQLRDAMSAAVAGNASPHVVETNLFDLWDAELPQPTLAARSDGKFLLYPGKIHWLSAEPGAGKTFLALAWTLEQARAGVPVVYIDMESDAVTIASRLRTLGAARDELRLVRYLSVRWEMSSLASTIESIVAKMTQGDVAPSLVVLDGLATALAQLGLDENSNSDISRFTSSVLRPLTSSGAAMLVVDHVAKAQGQVGGSKPGAPGRYARGAGAKLADASGVAYQLVVQIAYSQTKPGKAGLFNAKDRNGAVGAANELIAEIAFTPGGDGTLSVEVNVPVGTGDRWIPSGLMEKLSRVLATAGTMTATEASTALGTKSWQKHGATVTALLDKHGFITVERKGTSKLFTHIKPFTDADAEWVRTAEHGPIESSPMPKDDPF